MEKLNIRKLYRRTQKVQGVGVNDADYPTQPIVDGKSRTCVFFKTWDGMLTRAYSERFKATRPTYITTTVCEEWLSFMTFKAWMEKQDYCGKELDKDILYPNNKHYSPKNCCFVPRELNTLMAYKNGSKSLPTGVHYRKDTGKYRAIIYIKGKNVSLGQFITAKEAELTYLLAKKTYLKSIYKYVSKHIRKGLKRHTKLLKTRIKNIR